MRPAAIVTSVITATISLAAAGVDVPPPPPAGPPEPMPTADDDIPEAVIGGGAIREARVVLGDDDVYELRLRTERGWSRDRLDAAAGNGTFYTLDELGLVDVLGDREPEVWLGYSSYRDPCGCDDGPTFSSDYVVVCRVDRNGPRCSDPIRVAMRNHALELESFQGELSITRRGVARVKVLEAEGVSRRERAAIARPHRLFR